MPLSIDKKRALLAAIASYALVLTLAAFFEPVAALLEQINVHPGVDVFRGQPDTRYAHRAVCVYVVARREDGKKELIYQNPELCDDPPFYNLTQDPYDLVLTRFINTMERHRAANDPRQTEMEHALAEHFCRSATLSIAVQQVRIDLEQRARDRRALVLMHYDCSAGRMHPEPWPSLDELLP